MDGKQCCDLLPLLSDGRQVPAEVPGDHLCEYSTRDSLTEIHLNSQPSPWEGIVQVPDYSVSFDERIQSDFFETPTTYEISSYFF